MQKMFYLDAITRRDIQAKFVRQQVLLKSAKLSLISLIKLIYIAQQKCLLFELFTPLVREKRVENFRSTRRKIRRIANAFRNWCIPRALRQSEAQTHTHTGCTCWCTRDRGYRFCKAADQQRGAYIWTWAHTRQQRQKGVRETRIKGATVADLCCVSGTFLRRFSWIAHKGEIAHALSTIEDLYIESLIGWKWFHLAKEWKDSRCNTACWSAIKILSLKIFNKDFFHITLSFSKKLFTEYVANY